MVSFAKNPCPHHASRSVRVKVTAARIGPERSSWALPEPRLSPSLHFRRRPQSITTEASFAAEGTRLLALRREVRSSSASAGPRRTGSRARAQRTVESSPPLHTPDVEKSIRVKHSHRPSAGGPAPAGMRFRRLLSRGARGRWPRSPGPRPLAACRPYVDPDDPARVTMRQTPLGAVSCPSFPSRCSLRADLRPTRSRVSRETLPFAVPWHRRCASRGAEGRPFAEGD